MLLAPAVVLVVCHTDLTTDFGHMTALMLHELPPWLGPKPEFTTLELVAVKGRDQSGATGSSRSDILSPPCTTAAEFRRHEGTERSIPTQRCGAE